MKSIQNIKAKALCLTIALMLFFNIKNSNAQSLGDPVVDITFGSGTATHSGALPADSGSTSYTYTSADFPQDGSYTIENTTNSPNVWWTTTDHTGNTGGYMMVVNASVSKTDYFYKREVAGLCGGTTYQFSAFIGNLLRYSDLSPPDIIFSIETTDGTVIQSYDTGPVAQRTSGFKWIQYAFDFTLPANVSNVVIKMSNNSNGGAPANDLALDDITFRPYGPSLVAAFSSSSLTSISACAGQTTPYTLTVAPVSGYTSPAYQWQVDINNVWTNIPGATSLSYTANPTAVGTYEYRLASAEASNIGSASCRVVSNVLTIVIDDAPSSVATANTPLCVGNTLNLTTSAGTSYSWTGPNGFTSTLQSPLIDNITAAAAGNYKVTVTSGNCTSNATVTVNVYAQPTANAGPDVTICAGDNTTLNASGGTTGYSWSPTKGLSDPNIANPIASPTDTTAYVVTVSNSNACTATDTVIVNVLKKPVANAGANEEITQGQSIQLNGTAKGTAVSYYWTPDTYLSSSIVLNPIATPPADITYTLHVISTVGCGNDATADVFIRVYKAITIPNTFTPNGDGINDTWDITALDTYPESSTQIFDRYGSRVFASTGYSRPWDGTCNNRSVPVGTYYYLIDLKNGHKYSGWVLVVR